MDNLCYLWSKANLNNTPKIHSYLKHAINQMKRFNGTGDMLEDDVEHIHQKAAKIESRIGWMKKKEHQAYARSWTSKSKIWSTALWKGRPRLNWKEISAERTHYPMFQLVPMKVHLYLTMTNIIMSCFSIETN
jgi:hypothetical protein